jgi:Fic family protein
MNPLPPEVSLDKIETRKVLKMLASTHAALAELKGVSATIPNEQILIDTLSLQEARDSSAIENIVTTHDELYKSNYSKAQFASAAAKEVHRYAEALKEGFHEVREKSLITVNMIIRIQKIIEKNNAGLRKLPGTELRNELTGKVVYTPPQDSSEIIRLMSNLEEFISDEKLYSADPLVKMALIHHQFESIHPFYDGNGRTGRILNLLYLIHQKLLNIPVLYISRYIIAHRQEYYSLLQSTRDTGNWEPWVLYMLEAVRATSIDTIALIKEVKNLMMIYKQRIRSEQPKMYSQDLINNLFKHPYTKIVYLQSDLQVSRLTATRYLDRLVEMELLDKMKFGKSNYYINFPLFALLKKPISPPSSFRIKTTNAE